MEKENVKEYELIREEMLKIKECITSYMSIVLGGSGAIFFGLAAFFNKLDYFLVAFATFVLSLIILLVLLILFYKFNSHNRAAGYCKLLNQERFIRSGDSGKEGSFIAWEVCMDGLRASDVNSTNAFKLCEEIEIDGLNKESVLNALSLFYTKKMSIDKLKIIKGMGLVPRIMFGLMKTRSWRFPLYIVLVFMSLITLYIGGGVYFTYCAYKSNEPTMIAPETLLWFAAIIVAIDLWMGINFAGKLHTLINGSNTVDAYCWKFLPFRYHFIKERDGAIVYSLTRIRGYADPDPKSLIDEIILPAKQIVRRFERAYWTLAHRLAGALFRRGKE